MDCRRKDERPEVGFDGRWELPVRELRLLCLLRWEVLGREELRDVDMLGG